MNSRGIRDLLSHGVGQLLDTHNWILNILDFGCSPKERLVGLCSPDQFPSW